MRYPNVCSLQETLLVSAVRRCVQNVRLLLMKYRTLALLALLFVCAIPVQAQNRQTMLQGRVVDGLTGEGIPFVQIVFEGSTRGASSDMEGQFSVVDTAGRTTVLFQMMGYESHRETLSVGERRKRIEIRLTPRQQMLGAVEITAKRGRTRYSRRNNPAVELARNVIEHKQTNRPESFDRFSREAYEKMTLAFDDFHPDFENNRIWRKFDFLQKYIDRTAFDDTPVLTVSMSESMEQQSFSHHPKRTRHLITARRSEGLAQYVDKENLSVMFKTIDICDNDIELMLNHFVSPLSSTLGTTFYKFYITDTVEIEGKQCVELSFVPVSKESYGFTGRMYVSVDSCYSLARYEMNVSPSVNLNFVRDLHIIQDFDITPSGMSIPRRYDTYARMYLHRRLPEIYAHRTQLYTGFAADSNASILPDSLFTPFANTAVHPRADKVRRRELNAIRPLQLTAKETMIDSLRYEIARFPEIRAIKKTAEILLDGYAPTARVKDSSFFDVGPLYNIVSHNHEEGWRLRLGGMTTARLNPNHFFDGYVAYGFHDKRLKYSASYTYTFQPKKHHLHESPHSLFGLVLSSELENPGQNYEDFDRDNILMSTDLAQKVQYVRQLSARFSKEWDNHISIDTRLTARCVEPAGLLSYTAIGADGTLHNVERFNDMEWIARVSFSPQQLSSNQRGGSGNMMNLNRNAPKIGLTHRVGFIEGDLFYQRTDFTAEKNIWLSSFGYINAIITSGVVWNRVPFPHLYMPSGGGEFFLSPAAFNTMKPMEFVMDQQVSVFLTYHMKGLILRHIPLIKRLLLREVVGFNLLYGGLSAKNNPAAQPFSAEGLYVFPYGTSPIGTTPYMEYSIGIENILKFIRIDYVRRLSYVDGMDSRRRGIVRVQLRFTL